MRALRFSALDFIEKPIDPQRLRQAVSKVYQQEKNKWQLLKQIEILMGSFQSPPQVKETIAVPMTKGELEIVRIKEIKYIESDGTISYLYLLPERKLTAMRGLSHFDSLLRPLNFHRISNKLLVNELFIQRYTKDNYVYLQDGQRLEASRRKGAEFRKEVLEKEERNSPSKREQLLRELLRRFKRNTSY